MVYSVVLAVSAQAAQPDRNDYSKPGAWLCRPGRHDACDVDLRTTVVAADGQLTAESFAPEPKAPIDCFYVYPTVSLDTTPNSDMIAGPEERAVVRQQFARFASRCRPYAPLYRQVTRPTLLGELAGKPRTGDRAVAYRDVLDAWNYYLQHDNAGRGVVLIGHSQGSSILMPLIAAEIDGKPVQSRIVSALLIGWNIPVPKAGGIGGAFQHMPLCKARGQVGCVISYVSFRASAPPPPDALFGRVPDAGMVAACVNPAALDGSNGELRSYFLNRPATDTGPAIQWLTPPRPIETPFVSTPGLVSADCASNGAGSYLAVSVHPNPGGQRYDDIHGDVMMQGKVQPGWGLHLIDMDLAMGNLLRIVGEQSSVPLGRGSAAEGKSAAATDPSAAPSDLPKTMHAVAMDRTGGPDVLHLRALPVPRVDADEVLIAVHTAGVGVWDSGIRTKLNYINQPRFPFVMGSDGAGIIAAVGSAVTTFKVGDPVYSYNWDNPKGGFYAEYVAVAAKRVGHLPQGIALDAAGALGASGLTAIQGIDDALHITAGETLIIHGASGAVGTLAIQFAKLRGAKVLAIASGEDGVALVRRLGADAAIDGKKEDIAAAVRRFAPSGADALLALAGGDALQRCMEALRPGGRVAYPNGSPEPNARAGINATAYDAISGTQEYLRLNQAIGARRLEIPIADQFPLADAAQAHRRMEAGHVLGKIILRIR
jgi:NADPH:quinone reductase-like Zn-dependent oxidoreductase